MIKLSLDQALLLLTFIVSGTIGLLMLRFGVSPKVVVFNLLLLFPIIGMILFWIWFPEKGT